MDTLTTDLLNALPPLDSDTQEAKATPVSLGTLSVTTGKLAAWERGLPYDGAASFDYLFKRLVTEKAPLFLLGESPGRSLSISLAVMRGSLKHIWATRLKPEGVFWTRGDLLEHIEQSRKDGKSNADLLARNGLSYAATDTDFDNFRGHSLDEMDFLPNLFLKADACHLRTFFDDHQLLHLPHKHIFFQCPWIGWKDTGSLMRETVQSAAEIQGPGDLLIFGLRDTKPNDHPKYPEWLRKNYESAYEVPKLQKLAVDLGYKSLTEDKDLIRRCLHFGYRHYSESSIDIHHYLVRDDELIIYSFIKKSPPK
ncbi:hypothetical protein DFH06DRAFT_526964 [Mycena polygramma]|nr:hypothetical protein DFH06DRAFT_526964 [Mycena polygramma]